MLSSLIYPFSSYTAGNSVWSSPATNPFNPVVVTVLLVGFPGKNFGPATGVFACNCPVPEAVDNGGVRTYACTLSHLSSKYYIFQHLFSEHCTIMACLQTRFKYQYAKRFIANMNFISLKISNLMMFIWTL